MVEQNVIKIRCRLEGIRPLMFDKYPGDNNTQLPVAEKMYLNESQHLIMPAINMFSLLCAENGKSVCKQFFGKQGKTIGLGIKSGVIIEEAEIPILGENNKQIKFTEFDGKVFKINRAVARIKGGVPNPKERPVLNLPWAIEFDIEYYENSDCSLGNLRQAFDMGGKLGLGTFRPFFGMYKMVKWEEIK